MNREEISHLTDQQLLKAIRHPYVKGNKKKWVLAEANKRELFSYRDLRLISKKSVGIGMDEKAMLIALGDPLRVNETVTSAGIIKQYVYHSMYVYVENGRVTSWQSFE